MVDCVLEKIETCTIDERYIHRVKSLVTDQAALKLDMIISDFTFHSPLRVKLEDVYSKCLIC